MIEITNKKDKMIFDQKSILYLKLNHFNKV